VSTPGTPPTGSSLGLTACHHCGTVWKGAGDGGRCSHCGTALHRRKAHSLQRTWALLLAALVMYIPANMLPVMVSSSLIKTQTDTILSGVIYFWVTGAWGLAVVVFVASFMVPLFKLAALLLLVVTAQRRSSWRRNERTKLYRIVELIGRWSMLDVFVVTLMAGVVRIEGFAEVTAGIGIAAFAAVVVLTMLAALSFDPRLIWDGADTPAPAVHISEPIPADNPPHGQHSQS